MPGPEQPALRNLLLSRLEPDSYARLRPHLEPVDCPRGARLLRPGEPIEHVWFPESGIGSLIAISPEGQKVEAGMYGRDGLSPAALVLGSDSTPHEITFQLAGSAHRIAAPELARALNESEPLRILLLRYVQSFAVQTTYTALSNAVHSLDERCARWLLMCHDRIDGDEVPLTHDYLSLMLAVRRPSVTTALHVLEGNRLIAAERGWITVRDRPALEEFAGDAYGKPEAEYQRLLGPLR